MAHKPREVYKRSADSGNRRKDLRDLQKLKTDLRPEKHARQNMGWEHEMVKKDKAELAECSRIQHECRFDQDLRDSDFFVAEQR